MDIEKIRKAFDEYVKKFDMNDIMIKAKYEHTYRVAKQSMNIAKSIGLDEENIKLAYLIGILHDIGRFEQAKRYQTYNDSKSIDHAEFGCQLLFDEGLIRKFIDDNKFDDLIGEAIYYHNKYAVCSWEEDDMKLLHSEIIRDADKIDIIHNVVDIGEIKLPEDDFGVSPEVTEDFNLKMLVNHNHKRTKNDSTLTMVAFVFDLNFDYSYEYFKNEDFVNKIFNKLNNKDLFEPYIDIANKHIERKLKDAKCKIFS